MKVVLNSWWEPQGISTLAVQIAQYLEGRGHSVQIMPWQRDAVGQFDHAEQSHWFRYRGRPFKELLSHWQPDLCIPVHHVPYDIVSMSMSYKVRVCPLIMWERVKEYMPALVRSYRVLVTNRTSQRYLIGKYKLSNVHCIPWVLQGKPTKPKAARSRCRLLYNAGKPHDRRCGHLVFHAVREMLAAGRKVQLKVRWLQHLNEKDQHVFNVLCQEYPEQVWSVQHDQSYRSVLKDFEKTDLFLWPTKYEGLGLMGMEAHQQGCVVVAPDSPVVNEMLSPAARLVQGVQGQTYEGVPMTMPSQADWSQAVSDTIDNLAVHASTLREWQLSAADRHRQFDEAWDKILH